MAGISVPTLVAAKQNDAKIVAGVDHFEVDGLNLKIFTTSGDSVTLTFPEPTGMGISNMYINAQKHMIVILDNGTVKDCGEVPGGTSGVTTRIVSSLPSEHISPTTIYLLTSTDSKGNDIYEEYLYVNNKWERFGTRTSAAEEISENSAENTDIDNIFN